MFGRDLIRLVRIESHGMSEKSRLVGMKIKIAVHDDDMHDDDIHDFRVKNRYIICSPVLVVNGTYQSDR